MKNNRKVLAIFVFLFLWPASTPAHAQPENPVATIDDFAWLAGRWEGRLPTGQRLEQVWLEPADGQMSGTFRLLDDGKVVLLEIFSLYETPAGLDLYVRHFDTELVPGEQDDAIRLKLASYDGETGLFENPVHNRPKTAAFIRTEPGRFTGRSEIIRDDGSVRVIEARWKRAGARERALRKSVTVPASLEEVWHAWTTIEGVKTFFGPDARVEATLGGPYEIYFDPSAPEGSRGSEGCKVHSMVPMTHFAFTWNAPPSVPAVRNAGLHTLVSVRLYPEGSERTRVEVSHTGWGKGENWDKTYDYFDSAWEGVLGNLRHRFTVGPVEWPGHFIRAGGGAAGPASAQVNDSPSDAAARRPAGKDPNSARPQAAPSSATAASDALGLFYGIAKRNLLAAAEETPEDDYAFRPTPEVRSFGQLIAHVADTLYLFCSSARQEQNPNGGPDTIEKTKTAKGDLLEALRGSFAYCDPVYETLTDADLGESVTLVNRERPRAIPVTLNVYHLSSHYGHVTTYMRLQRRVPPSSRPRGEQ